MYSLRMTTSPRSGMIFCGKKSAHCPHTGEIGRQRVVGSSLSFIGQALLDQCLGPRLVGKSRGRAALPSSDAIGGDIEKPDRNAQRDVGATEYLRGRASLARRLDRVPDAGQIGRILPSASLGAGALRIGLAVALSGTRLVFTSGHWASIANVAKSKR